MHFPVLTMAKKLNVAKNVPLPSKADRHYSILRRPRLQKFHNPALHTPFYQRHVKRAIQLLQSLEMEVHVAPLSTLFSKYGTGLGKYYELIAVVDNAL